MFGGGDRRLRPHHGQGHQALKCPRCESLNTKFCYYNNYNLSQPRHFCKSCRRYWTKGGVLRNVPVGGGCRKTKRSKSKACSSDATPRERKSSNSQNSSSESSSLTASTTAATTPTTTTNGTVATEVLSGSSSNSVLNFQESRFFSIPQSTTGNPSFDPSVMDQSSESGMFPEIGTFTSLMMASNDPLPLGFNIANISSYRLHQQSHGQVVENQSSDQQWHQLHHHQQQQKMMENDVKMHELGGGYLDQTVQMEYSGLQNRTSDGGLAVVDWQNGGDQGLFDLAGTVDQSYWNQTQWPDNDHQLDYLP